jgi:hypothetical protein
MGMQLKTKQMIIMIWKLKVTIPQAKGSENGSNQALKWKYNKQSRRVVVRMKTIINVLIRRKMYDIGTKKDFIYISWYA